MEYGSVELLRDTLRRQDRETFAILEEVIAMNSDQIAATFYRVMMKHELGRDFLDHKVVEQRLKTAMSLWIKTLFSRKTPGEVESFIQKQQAVGDIHARMHIPFSIVQIGCSALKKEVFFLLCSLEASGEDIANLVVIADELLDSTFAVMNQAFITDMVVDARDQQSLKLHSIGIELALQVEGLRASLFDWHRSILRLLLQTHESEEFIPCITKTDFGLWVFHKGDILFPETPELKKLKNHVSLISQHYRDALAARNNQDISLMSGFLNGIDSEVTAATQTLATITERTMTLESGRDPLTKLFNRRYLRTVLQQEVTLCKTSMDQFGILIIDIDYFKKFNDQYGHDVGDEVLKQSAEVLLTNVRAGDFVFRYGGEEFLIVLTSVNRIILEKIAHKLVGAFRSHAIQKTPLDEGALSVTVSVGGALFDGHPDFERTIHAADNALFQAKNNGRDRYVL